MPMTSPLFDSWRDGATCRAIVESPTLPFTLTHREAYDLFFPTRHSNSASSACAKRICNTFCPVREQCLAAALREGDKLGIRGGMTANDRRKLRRSSPLAAHPDEAAVVAFGAIDDYLTDADDDSDEGDDGPHEYCEYCADEPCRC